jgi:hypothetical protein
MRWDAPATAMKSHDAAALAVHHVSARERGTSLSSPP